MKQEIRDFLIYLHLKIMSNDNTLKGAGYATLYMMQQVYPQFKDIRRENEKIFEWLKEQGGN